MSFHGNHEGSRSFNDYSETSHQYDQSELAHKKHVRQMLEDRLERRRLKEELEFFDGELDAEFDWDNYEVDK